MQLFRSEEHARRWSGFRSGTGAGILPLSAVASLMGTPRHSAKLNGHYVSSGPEYAAAFRRRVVEVTRDDPFWRPAGS